MRGVRGGSPAARESQKKLRNRNQRKKWAQELSNLEAGGKHRPWWKLRSKGPETNFHKNRVTSLKSKLNIPKEMPKTTKPDGSKIEPTTSGSIKSQDKAQQKVIDSKEYKEGRKKQEDEYKAGDLSKNPKKPYYSSALGRYVTGAGIKAQAAADREKMLKNQSKKDTQKKLETAYDQGKKDGTPSPKSEPKRSTVFTRHYKTGKKLGVMTKRQRDKYDKEAAAAGGKSFGERVDATGDKSNKRETKYIASQRKKSNKKSKNGAAQGGEQIRQAKNNNKNNNKNKKEKRGSLNISDLQKYADTRTDDTSVDWLRKNKSGTKKRTK